MRTGAGRVVCVVAALLAAGCGTRTQLTVAGTTSGGTTASTGTGGAPGAGGSTSTGGTTGSGGVTGQGGSTVTAFCAQVPLGSPAPGPDVTGTLIVRHVLEDGSVLSVPADLSGAPIQAFVLSAGAWTSYPGKGQQDGSFVIPGVPPGPYVLELHETGWAVPGERFLYTAERTLTLGYDVGGRPDPVTSSSGAWLLASLENLEPWVGTTNPTMPSDLLSWVSFDSHGAAVGPLLSAGATTVQGGTVQWNQGLVDGSKGDILYAAQLSLRMTAATPYVVLTRLGTFTGVQMAPLQSTPVSATLVEPPATGSFAVDLRASQFASLGPAIHPGTQITRVGAGIMAIPGGQITAGGPAVLLSVRAGSTDVQVGPLSYPHAFPPAWSEVAFGEVVAPLSIDVPGSSQPADATGIVRFQTTLGKATSTPLVPLLGPVQDPRVGGQDAFTAHSGVSTTPVLSWKPPAIGSAAGYAVAVLEIDGMTQTLSAVLITADTSLTLPPCLLAQGHPYYFVITAIMTSGPIVGYPFLRGAEWATADAVTSGVLP